MTPRDVDLGRIDADSLGVVECERGLGRVRRRRVAEPLKMTSATSLAPQALDALLAQDPFDGVDDV